MLINIAQKAQDTKAIKRSDIVAVKPKYKPMQQLSFKSPPPMLLFAKKGIPKNSKEIRPPKNNERIKFVHLKLLLKLIIMI